MSGALTEFRARAIVQTMHRIKNDVDVFSTHAHTLKVSSKSFDGLPLLEEADRLLRALKASRSDFEEVAAQTASLSRSLPSRPLVTGGLPPAAKWGSEFRAGSKQFVEAVRRAEKAIAELYGAANEKLNSPTRTPTGAPENILDVLINFIDGLSRWIEYRRKKH
jgi:hypothetical protein